MIRNIRLIFHVGFGKTATTWMQKQIFSNIALNEKNCIYLGKLRDSGIMLDDRFNKLHYELFSSLNRPKQYRGRNSTKLVNSYAKVISCKITNKFNSINSKDWGNVIVSNESIAGYGGYDAELNLFLLKNVIEKIRVNLGDSFHLDEQILVTFREQASLLQSHYAYDYYHLSGRFKTFDKFIEYGLNNHHNDIFGSLWIDEIIQFISDIFGKDSVMFVPYELLKENEREFLIQTVVNLGIVPKTKINKYLNLKKENTNYKKEIKGNFIRDVSKITKLIVYLSKYSKFFPQTILSFAKYIYISIKKKQKTVIKGELVMTQKQRESIRNLYSYSNSVASKMTSFDLGKLGYAVKKMEQYEVDQSVQ